MKDVFGEFVDIFKGILGLVVQALRTRVVQAIILSLAILSIFVVVVSGSIHTHNSVLKDSLTKAETVVSETFNKAYSDSQQGIGSKIEFWSNAPWRVLSGGGAGIRVSSAPWEDLMSSAQKDVQTRTVDIPSDVSLSYFTNDIPSELKIADAFQDHAKAPKDSSEAIYIGVNGNLEDVPVGVILIAHTIDWKRMVAEYYMRDTPTLYVGINLKSGMLKVTSDGTILTLTR